MAAKESARPPNSQRLIAAARQAGCSCSASQPPRSIAGSSRCGRSLASASTWSGSAAVMVADVVAGAREVVAAGGLVPREPEPEDGEPPHLAMCVDPEGNEFMLSRKRH